MEKKDNKSAASFSWKIRDWYPDISESENIKLKTFAEELLKANSQLSLISPKTVPFVDAIHISDSILGSRLIYKNSKPTSLVDFASGNGLPGLVYAILYPECSVLCVDGDKRKTEFIQNVANLLGLKNVKTSYSGIEAFSEGSWQFVVSRGSFAISKFLLTLRKPIKKGGVYYFLKGEEWATEVAQIPSQLCSFWQPELVGDYKLPVGEMKFAVVRLNKFND